MVLKYLEIRLSTIGLEGTAASVSCFVAYLLRPNNNSGPSISEGSVTIAYCLSSSR